MRGLLSRAYQQSEGRVMGQKANALKHGFPAEFFESKSAARMHT